MLDLEPWSEENPYYSLERLRNESVEKGARLARRISIGISIMWILIWFATMALVRAHPEWLGLMPSAMCR